MKKLLLIAYVIGLLASCAKINEIPQNHIGEFRLEKTQEIFFDGYTKGEYNDVHYNLYCEERTILFITADSIGFSNESWCGTADYSLYRWSYDKIKVSEIEDNYIKDKYEQIPDLDYIIRYYPSIADSSYLKQGYFSVYETSDYDVSLITYDRVIFHMLKY